MSTLLRFLAIALSVLLALPAGAAQRTFVASTGVDTNPCTLAAPCRSFTRALTQTDANGEVIVLDSAGYQAPVTINKSLSIIAPEGVYAGISVFAGDGITVSGGNVLLRGLAVNGQGGSRGIVVAAGTVRIEKCIVSRMNGPGIEVTGAGPVHVQDSMLRDNQGGFTATGSVAAQIHRSSIERNGNTGVTITNGPRLTITDSVVAGNFGLGGISAVSNDGTSTTVLAVSGSDISNNQTQGISASASTAGSVVQEFATRNTIVRNGATGFLVIASTGSAIAAVSDNLIAENFGNGGVHAGGAGATVTASNNTVARNHNVGFTQSDSALFRTRSNNTVEDNVTGPTSGVITSTSGR